MTAAGRDGEVPGTGDAFLDLLYGEAPLTEFDGVITRASAAGASEDRLAELRRQHAVAVRLRELIARQRVREAELTALYETARDLTAIRELDTILAAIVRRARQLLNADMTYLSLNDEAEGASYMKVTDGALTQEFRSLRLPLGTGLLGLVAQTGAPYFTEDYQADERFVHRGYIDEAVAGEHIRAILGVPLVVDGRVIGALLAVHRTVRRFPSAEVQLLTSFAAHAAVALENARLFADLDEANRTLTAHTTAIESAARAHDLLTDVLLGGGSVGEVADVLAGVLDGEVAVYDPDGELVGGTPAPGPWRSAVEESVASGRTARAGAVWVAAAVAGAEHLGTLVLHGRGTELREVEHRTLERGAVVTALVLLFARSVAEAEERLGGELLADLVDGAADPLLLRERLRRHGVALGDRPLVVAAASAGPDGRAALHRGAVRIARAERGLAAEHAGAVVLLAPGADAVDVGRRLRDAVEAADAGSGRVTVGVAVADGELPPAYADARRCLDVLLTLGRQGDVSDQAGLGVARLLLGTSGPDELAAFVDRTLGPVLAWDERRGTALRATLDAWFATGCQVRSTAERLHVHPNTVVQRLDRVGELLGPAWREPGRSLDLQLALRMVQLQAVR
ncbi:MAG: GAF domain-containing protein [Nocardioides sp.]|nr:GAF domain-containing protein [Nocardioides sp.]